MTTGGPRACYRPRRALTLALLALLIGWAGSAVAQVRPDTVPGDTILVPIPPEAVEGQDTLPADSLLRTAQDTVRVPIFPRYPRPLPTGFAHGRWEWGREALTRFHGISLLEFLERTPGLTIVRSGDHGYPAGITALGMAGGRVRVLVDGFELDPLGFVTPDLQQISAMDLESVRIEREPSGIRIELTTLRLPENRPFSAVEAGTGTYEAKFLRGLLSRAIGGRSIVTASYDAVSTEGFAYDEPFGVVSAQAAWSYALNERTGFQVEVRNTGVERVPPGGSPLAENFDRRLLLLRGRSELAPGVVVDGALGRTRRAPADDDLLTTSLSSTQGLLRASYSAGLAWAEGSLRLRDEALVASSAPRFEAAVRAVVRPRPWIAADGEIRTGRLGEEGSIVWRGTARVGRAGAPALFATVAGGEQGVGLVRDSAYRVPDPSPAANDSLDRNEPRYSAVSAGIGSLRAGAEWSRGGIGLGLAGVTLAGARVVPFGFAFDRGLPAFDVDAATGVEGDAALAVPGTRGIVSLDGSASYWMERGGRPYLPELDARAALAVHSVFYEGQLEPTLRFEVHHRGAMLAPAEGGALAETTPHTLTNLFLQIRIIDLQVFGLWENLANVRTAADIPGLTLPGTRLFYGIRWVFRD